MASAVMEQRRIGYMKIPPLVKKSTMPYLIDLMSVIYLSFSAIAIVWGGYRTGAVEPVCRKSRTGAGLKRTVILEKSQLLNLMDE